MKLEAQTLAKIKSRINEKVMSCHGTWIDWQYLLDAAALLAKCRYTLQYTYPYAYYMEPSPRKELVSVFEKFLVKTVKVTSPKGFFGLYLCNVGQGIGNCQITFLKVNFQSQLISADFLHSKSQLITKRYLNMKEIDLFVKILSQGTRDEILGP